MRRLLLTLPALALLAACSGGGGGLPETATPADLPTLASTLEGELGVDCDGEVITDYAGFDKVVCSVPDGYDVPEGIGMALQSWSDREAMEDWCDSFGGDGFAAGEGWFVSAPSQEVADAAAEVLP